MIGEIISAKHVTPGSENRLKKRGLESAENQMANDLVSPPAKKMKQARLPFAPKMSPSNCMTKVVSPSHTTVSPELKKRRISDENCPLSGDYKSKMAGSGTKSSLKPTVIIIDEEEQVPSSSSEAGPPAPKARGTPSKTSSLDGFLQTTQQPQVTTSNSTVIDLTDDSENNLDSSTSSAPSPDTSDDEDVNSTQEQQEDQSVEASPSMTTPTQPVHSTIGKKLKLQKTLQKEEEKQKQREEKARIREGRKRKLEAEKEAKKEQRKEIQRKKQQELDEAQREKEAKRKERQAQRAKEEEEREEKKRLKQEERQKKQSLLDSLQAEKQKKQEEKDKLESEKKKEIEEAKKKNAKQQMMFKSFFKKQCPDSTPITNDQYEVCGPFAAFQLRKDMVIAPTLRTTKMKSEDVKQRFEETLQVQRDASCNYLRALSSGDISVGQSGRTKGSRKSVKDETEEDDVQEVGSNADSSNLTLKAKLFQFHENHRPAYYGTWRKASKTISGRRPLLKDEDLLDYEVDSDDEWEDPGESLSDSGSEDEDDSDGDESDDGFFVPHGYLSEDEDEGAAEDDKETWEKRRAAKAKDWDNEMKRKTEQLKTVLIGCMWSTSKTAVGGSERLCNFKAVPMMSTPILLTGVSSPDTETNGKRESEKQQILAAGNKIRPVPKEAMPDLIRLVHGNMAGIKKLCREFKEFWRRKNCGSSCADGAPSKPAEGGSDPTSQIASPLFRSAEDFMISKRQLEKKITKIAVRCKRDGYPRILWYVHDHILKEYKMEQAPVPSEWVFVTKKPFDPTKPTTAPSPAAQVTARSPPENKGGLFAMLTPVSSGKSAAATLKSLATTSMMSAASNQPRITQVVPVLPRPSQSMGSPGPHVEASLLMNGSSAPRPVLPRPLATSSRMSAASNQPRITPAFPVLPKPSQSMARPGPRMETPLLINSSSAPRPVLPRPLPSMAINHGSHFGKLGLQNSGTGASGPPCSGGGTSVSVAPNRIEEGIVAFLPPHEGEDDCVVIE